MAQSSYPFENIDTTETQFSRWARHIGEGVNGGPDDTKLKAVGDDSGMQVRVASGQCMVRGHYYASTAQETLAIDSAGVENRIDAVVLELDPAANEIILKIVQGLAVPSDPEEPTLTKTDTGIYQVLIGLVKILPDATSILPANVTDRRTFLSAQLAFSPFLLMGA
jgi:hypothetical protein